MTDYFCLMSGLGTRFQRAWLQLEGHGASERLHLVIDHFWSKVGVCPYLTAPAEIYIHPYEVQTISTDDDGRKTILFKWPKNYFRMRKGEYEPALEKLRAVLQALPPAMKGPAPATGKPPARKKPRPTRRGPAQ